MSAGDALGAATRLLTPALTPRLAVADFLLLEAALLDEWRLDESVALSTDHARYAVPTTGLPEGGPRRDLVLVDDNLTRLQGRLQRLKRRRAHGEYPRSRTRRLLTNARVTGVVSIIL